MTWSVDSHPTHVRVLPDIAILPLDALSITRRTTGRLLDWGTLNRLKVLCLSDTPPLRGQNVVARTFGVVPVDVRNVVQSQVTIHELYATIYRMDYIITCVHN